MSSRFPSRDTSRSLFSAYDATTSRQKSRSPPQIHNPKNPARQYPGPYTSPAYPSSSSSRPSSSAYGNSAGSPFGGDSYSAPGSGATTPTFRSATPNKRGQYSDAVLSELESQNDEQLEGMSARVRMLKDITVAIGQEIKDSTSLAESMNLSFENTSTKLKGTMNRMLRMAQKTGVGWRVWLGFFAAVILLFWWVRVF